ncbi:probable disease resistance protein At5g66900 [Cornus florida]|uniref:probable disease resistance protein At5g66900 n=1 Tax=Cornus florida TaxID=4283 RepID=UPI00289CB260|nr:probable disease resistance protein At5g66900 [Cornus florida]
MADVGGAGLGAVAGEALRAALDFSGRAISFDDNRQGLESRVTSMEPLIREIEEIGRELGLPEEEIRKFTDRQDESQKLVGSCSKTSRFNFWKRASKSKKIKELEDSDVKFYQTYVQLLQTRDNKKHEARLNEIYAILDEMRKGGRVCAPSVFVGPCGAPEAPGFTVGKAVPLHELKIRLLKDLQEEDAQVVVLSAPGGRGKTTLASMLCHDVEIKGVFKNNIFFVTFSKTPNLKVIVQKMFQHKNFLVPEYQDDDDAIIQLENLLKQIGPDPILLVLDDAWPVSESLIQKFKKRIPGYRILVTSRYEFPIFNCTYKLERLSDGDAMDLFCHSAFPHGGSINMPEDLVNKIVRGCREFPLALTVVGGSLCGRPEVIWKRTLEQWSKGQSIFDSNSDLLIRLQTSIDALDEKTDVKECFLDLGLFPEDQRIPAMALIDMWVELYNLDEDGTYALANIHELASRNLVNLVFTRKDASEIDGLVIDGYYNEHFLTQHDLLRDLAIYRSSQESIEQRKRLIMDISENDLSKWSIEQIQPFHARILSISIDETFSSSLNNMLLPEKTFSSNWYSFSYIYKSLLGYLSKLVQPSDKQLPEVEVLILNFRTTNYSLPEFMEKMDQLKVLIITNNGVCPAELSNFELLGHLSSLKRIRLEHVSISFLSESKLQFRNLRKISLIMCRIGETFRNCTVEFAYMFPNLVEIDIHCCSNLEKLPEGLCDIVCLKKLSITKCDDLKALPERLGMLTNLELLRLHYCTELTGLTESVGSLQKLRFLDISYCLSISNLPIRIGELCGLKKLDMRGCELGQLPASVKDLGQLKDVICYEDTADLWEPYKIYLNNLKITVLKEDKNLSWLPNLHH